MKAIFDRAPAPKKFPLNKLLSAIQLSLQISPEQAVSIRRLGGVGDSIWRYESRLDEGDDVVISFSDLQKLSESPEDYVDELLGTIGAILFGISDSCFMFVQCGNRETEATITTHFDSVRDIPDVPAFERWGQDAAGCQNPPSPTFPQSNRDHAKAPPKSSFL